MVFVSVGQRLCARFHWLRKLHICAGPTEKLKPRARVYVIAIGGFFEPTERVIAKKVMHNHAARTQYEDNRTLQFVHEAICMTLSSICGNNLAIFRSRQNGAWYMPQSRQFAGHELPVSYDQQIDKREIDDAIAIGRIFLSDLPAKPDCVILTAIPHVDTKLDEIQMPLRADLEKRWWCRNISMACKHLMVFIWTLQVQNAGPRRS